MELVDPSVSDLSSHFQHPFRSHIPALGIALQSSSEARPLEIRKGCGGGWEGAFPYCVFFFFFKAFKKIWMWTMFKVFIEFVTILLLFYVLVFWPGGMWDLSFPTSNQSCTPCSGR